MQSFLISQMKFFFHIRPTISVYFDHIMMHLYTGSPYTGWLCWIHITVVKKPGVEIKNDFFIKYSFQIQELNRSPNIDTGWCNNSGEILKGNPTAICQACSWLCSLLCCIYTRDVFIYQNLMNDF